MNNKKLLEILDNFSNIQKKLNNITKENFSEYAKLSKEYSDLKPLTDKINKLFKFKKELDDLEELLASEDLEIKNEATEEKSKLTDSIKFLEDEIKILLIPKDESDEKNAIIEIRAGTGGEEAALFASDLLRMYVKYSETKNWKTEIMDMSDTDHNGIKEVILNISGKDVFGQLKFESGTHRVQRVPETESGGRIHTSAATVAVLPEASDIDVEILEKDLRIDIFRSSGPGGQSVNTTDSAVRITHHPTGIVAQCQDEKSQLKNKNKAMKILRARIYDKIQAEQKAERDATRAGQIGSGDRSAKIRTYNFPQGRVTDHRITLSLYRLEEVLDGDLFEFVQQLALAAQEERLRLTAAS